MNLKELKGVLNTLLADSSTNFYTNDERLQALNSACSYINSELRILQTVVDITVTPLDPSIPIPANFVSLGKGVDWVSTSKQSTRLEHAVPMQLSAGWDFNESGEPQRYVMEGKNIYLYPNPKATGTVRLSYVAMPNKLIDDNDLPFYGDPRTQAYHEMIAYYAAWQLCLKDRDFEAAQQFMQYFQTRMIDLKENLRHAGGPVQPVWSDTYSTT